MSTQELTALLIDYGGTNDVASLQDATPYLEALAGAFGDRAVRDITAMELHAFHEQVRSSPAVLPLLTLLEKKSQRWESAYTQRVQGHVPCLQWESHRPVHALVELFDRRAFQAPRVLELGCGNGVNAVFMAERGARVTAVDISSTAIGMARERANAAGVVVDLVDGDVFDLDPPSEPYDLVFDRGMFHHVQVFHYEDYKRFVADQLRPGGVLHLICHHVSTRPTLLLDSLCGSVGKLLGFLSGALVETGAGFTADELHEIFDDRFRADSIELVWDDNNRPLRFVSAVMERLA